MFFLLTLAGCSLFNVHKMDIEQGNILSTKMVNRLHPGMSKTQVKRIMGTPLLVAAFTPDRVEYVYTFQAGNKPMQEKRVTCIFKHNRLVEIIPQSLSSL